MLAPPIPIGAWVYYWQMEPDKGGKCPCCGNVREPSEKKVRVDYVGWVKDAGGLGIHTVVRHPDGAEFRVSREFIVWTPPAYPPTVAGMGVTLA